MSYEHLIRISIGYRLGRLGYVYIYNFSEGLVSIYLKAQLVLFNLKTIRFFKLPLNCSLILKGSVI